MPAIAEKAKLRYHGMKVTREIYLDLEDDGYKYDMINGVLYMSPGAFFLHNRTIFKISKYLGIWMDANFEFEVVSEIDVLLPDGGDVLRPDISIILKENYNIIQGHIHGVPDIVVEVLSDKTKKRDLGEKADRYLKNGVTEYWIIDPDEKKASIWINKNKSDWEKKTGETIGGSVLKGFAIRAHEIFS